MLTALQKIWAWLRSPRSLSTRHVHLSQHGFSVFRGGEMECVVAWTDVKEVFAFKLDLLTTDSVCLGFRVDDKGDYVRVDEEMVGYSALVEEMQRVFPEYTKDWWMQVAFPAFATNFTQVWSRTLP